MAAVLGTAPTAYNRRTADKVRTYSFAAVSPLGSRTTGKMQATSALAVRRALSEEGWIPVSVKAPTGAGMDITLGSGAPKYKTAEQVVFARTLYQLIKAGISIQRSLQSMAIDAKPMHAKMLGEIADKVATGQTLSEAMEAYPKCFDEVFRAYVQSGEAAGTLVDTCKRLSVMLSKKAEIKSRITQVMAYPKMVGGAILVISSGIIEFLVPQFANIYSQFGATLPAPTLAVVNLSKIFPYVLVGLFATLFALRKVYKQLCRNPLNGAKIDSIRFRLPILGRLTQMRTMFGWVTTLSGALAAGVPFATSLDLAARASGSYWQIELVPRLQAALQSGRKMADEISEPDLDRLFPANIRTMVSVGEKTGELPEMLESVTDAIDDEIETIVAGLSAKIEVGLLLVLGVVVGGLLMVLYLPILQLASTAGKGLEK